MFCFRTSNKYCGYFSHHDICRFARHFSKFKSEGVASSEKLRNEKNRQFAAEIENLCKKSISYNVFRRDLNSLKRRASEIENNILGEDENTIYSFKDSIFNKNPELATLKRENMIANLKLKANRRKQDIDKFLKHINLTNIQKAEDASLNRLLNHHNMSRADQAATFVEMMHAGCHYGSRRSHVHNFMTQFIFASRESQHIFDLTKTVAALRRVMFVLQELAVEECQILFVGNSPASQEIVEPLAKDCGCGYLRHKFIAGSITNYSNMAKIARQQASFPMEKFSYEEYKETLSKQSFFRSLDDSPDFIVLLNRMGNEGLISEAKKRRIPIACLCDSDTSPKDIMYVIPGNDDSPHSVKYFMTMMSKAVKDVRQQKSLRQKEIFESSNLADKNKESNVDFISKVLGNLGIVGRSKEELINPRLNITQNSKFNSGITNSNVMVNKTVNKNLDFNFEKQLMKFCNVLLSGEKLIQNNGNLSELKKRIKQKQLKINDKIYSLVIDEYVEKLINGNLEDKLLINSDYLKNQIHIFYQDEIAMFYSKCVERSGDNNVMKNTQFGKFAGQENDNFGFIQLLTNNSKSFQVIEKEKIANKKLAEQLKFNDIVAYNNEKAIEESLVLGSEVFDKIKLDKSLNSIFELYLRKYINSYIFDIN